MLDLGFQGLDSGLGRFGFRVQGFGLGARLDRSRADSSRWCKNMPARAKTTHTGVGGLHSASLWRTAPKREGLGGPILVFLRDRSKSRRVGEPYSWSCRNEGNPEIGRQPKKSAAWKGTALQASRFFGGVLSLSFWEPLQIVKRWGLLSVSFWEGIPDRERLGGPPILVLCGAKS